MASDFKNTTIWKLLEERTKESTPQAEQAGIVLQALNEHMPKIQSILEKGAGDATKDFTLHDADHSFRVAQRMPVLIPEDVLPELSAFELALLLLSAYLHDIGMTPELKRVHSYYDYLLTGDTDDIEESEILEFQEFLDHWSPGLEPPITKEKPTKSDLAQARELITYFCRDRHNDWSGEWITENIEDKPLGEYQNWRTDLINICKSHHYGYEKLIQSEFDPWIATNDGAIVNRRYLALVLRVADILENDPERTPEILLQHRDIADSSLIYWYKDHDFRLTISSNTQSDKKQLAAYARPRNARHYKAVEDTLDFIEQELLLGRRLMEEHRLQKCVGVSEDLPHRWNIVADITKQIEPFENSFVYIDGAFRPDTKKVLELLSGVQLYGDPMVAVRELLQNAFDAVREVIAIERLRQENPGDDKWELELGKRFKVELRLEEENGETWLICKDDGIGMSRKIIEAFLLVSGKSKRPALLQLERKCLQSGFSSNRTGQFGIGVLSYFMIADKLVIETKRHQLSSDMDLNGWSFSTEGLGALGQLEAVPAIEPGTTVRLRLKNGSKLHSIKATEKVGLTKEYIERTVSWLPCNLTVSMPKINEQVNYGPGWIQDHGKVSTFLKLERIKDRLQDIDRDYSFPIMTAGRKDRIKSHELRAEEFKKQVLHTARTSVEESVFEGSIRFRYTLLWFALPGGNSLAHLDIETNDDGTYKISPVPIGFLKSGIIYDRTPEISWKGIRVESSVDRKNSTMHEFARQHNLLNPSEMAWPRSMHLELDILSEKSGLISINRKSIQLTEHGRKLISKLLLQLTRDIAHFIQDNKESIYTSLNCSLLRMSLPANTKFFWLHLKRNGTVNTMLWKRIEQPCLVNIALPTNNPNSSVSLSRARIYDRLRKEYTELLGKEIELINAGVQSFSYTATLTSLANAWGIDTIGVDERDMKFDDVWPQPGTYLAPVFHPIDSIKDSEKGVFNSANFPKTPLEICALAVNNGHSKNIIWNSESLVVKTAVVLNKQPMNIFAFNKGNILDDYDSSPNQVSACNFILRLIYARLSKPYGASQAGEFWNALCENNPSKAEAIWKLLFSDSNVKNVSALIDNSTIISISESGWQEEEYENQMGEFITADKARFYLEAQDSE